MIFSLLFACLAGILIGLSRQLNGRLSLSTSPLTASFWNHIVGFIALISLGVVIGGLVPPGIADVPWYAYFGGPIGVIFVAAGSWVIARIGAINTAVLLIGGQMISGVLFDFLRDTPPVLWASSLGIILIIAGMVVARGPRKESRES
jgi:bacterial/archaeal transporter family-2 protein